ncbi:MAG: DpnI domain-containing protein [Neisseria sp.]|nr:DpnI domain-containing protein [Neisseria sp.]
MHLYFNPALAENYKNAAQIARVLTESWMAENVYCPSCGSKPIYKVENGRPVQDFICTGCKEQFELKSKNTQSVGKKIVDGAYHTMIQRIQADDNPNFFFLSYSKSDYSVRQLLLVPKHFMTADMIMRRKPLPETAKRAGWIGCTIDIGKVPESGKIFLINQAQVVPPERVHQQWQESLFLRSQKLAKKSWLLAIMKCIEELPEKFDLQQVYQFERRLAVQFPENRHIKDKIRQQLQFLRDQNVIEFIARGQYRKVRG